MNLRQIEVFRAVMLTGGVGSAAELLHVSQPAVSKVLAQAARASGLVLFERVKGRLVPTPEARQLHAEAEAVWRGVERLRDSARELARPRRGRLRLAVSASLAPTLVPRAVAALYAHIAALHCRVDVLVPALLVEALLDRTAHLGVALLPIGHPSLSTVSSYRCGLSCVLPAGHRLADRTEIRAADLAGDRLVSSPPDTPYGQLLQRALGGLREPSRLDVEVRSATTAVWFVRAGVGLALVDAASVAGLDDPRLVVRPFAGAEAVDVAIVRNRQFALSNVDKAFVRAFDEAWHAVLPRAR